ncbi:MAG: MATE family efflux transporter, partial [Oscillospiraceae bacterium]
MKSSGADLGHGNIGKLLFSMAMPAIFAQVINALYNVVDRMFIGHLPEIGATALTGVGLTFPIIMIISAFSCLVGMGGAPRAAIKMGANDDKGAEEILGNCVLALLGLSVILTALILIFKKDLLLMFGANADTTLQYGIEYLSIYAIGTIFVQIVMGLNPFINAQGFAKTGMLTILIGAVI